MTFGEYSRQWLEITKVSKELNTKKMYATTLKYLQFLNTTKLQDLRHSHLQLAINQNLEHPKTCKNIYSTYSQIIKCAVRDRLLPRRALDDLLADISLPKHIKAKKRALSALEKEAFLNAELDMNKRAFVNILYYCGLRRGEALALTKEDIDIKNKLINVDKVIVFDGSNPVLKMYPKSEHSIRKVPLPYQAIFNLKSYTATLDQGEFLFHTQTGAMMTEIGYRRLWESIINGMNVALGYNPQAKKNKPLEKPIRDLTAHIFRHNYCSELCYQIPKISTKKIAELMGDTEKMVIEVYSHIIDEKEDVESVVEEMFSAV